MHKTKSLFIVFICLLSFISLAQDGSFTFIGHNFFNNKKLTNTQIRVIADNTTVTEFNTNEDDAFSVTLQLGYTYDVYLLNAKSQTMYLRVFANIPENKRKFKIKYELDIPFFPKDASTINTSKFKEPFHRLIFDGKNKFIDDTLYMNDFIRNIYKKEDTIIPLLTTEKIKEYVQLVGKLCLNNDKQTPLKNKQINLIDKQGQVISNSKTTSTGYFVFQGVDEDKTSGFSLEVTEGDNPNNEQVKLLNSRNQIVDIVTGKIKTDIKLLKSESNNIILKLKNKDFKYNVAGKLIATNGSDKKVLSEKNIYLLDAKNNAIQKTKTNAFGNFLFTKITPGQTYSIAYDSADTEKNYIVNLFSTKDKLIKRIDSISKHKFVYKFLALSNSSFNDMVIDDTELKMNVSGKLYGDNKNNPLTNFKVLLLGDNLSPIDSAYTNSNGDFMFSNASYSRQFSMTAESQNILDVFNNVLIFDNADNLLKVVSSSKAKKFNYKPLSAEMAKLSDIYIDDPWMTVMKNKATTNNNTIIENILFEFNKSELLAQSKQTLDKIILVLKSNKKIDIELTAHSDSKGSDEYNLKLSEQRALAAKNYITANGIDEFRINAKGFGESRLLNNCSNGVICSEDEHAVNRRLEFKLKFN